MDLILREKMNEQLARLQLENETLIKHVNVFKMMEYIIKECGRIKDLSQLFTSVLDIITGVSGSAYSCIYYEDLEMLYEANSMGVSIEVESIREYIELHKKDIFASGNKVHKIMDTGYIFGAEGYYLLSLLDYEGVRGYMAVYSASDIFDTSSVDLYQLLSVQISIFIQGIQSYATIQQMTYVDSLTKLKNRTLFNSKEAEEVNTIAMMDIDHFKLCNDTYGHAFGDIVLKEVGKVLRRYERDGIEIYRYGGEEFCLKSYLPGDMVAKICEKIRKEIEELDIQGYKVTLSSGVCSISPKIDNYKDILYHADKALYLAKKNGRNMVIEWYV